MRLRKRSILGLQVPWGTLTRRSMPMRRQLVASQALLLRLVLELLVVVLQVLVALLSAARPPVQQQRLLSKTDQLQGKH